MHSQSLFQYIYDFFCDEMCIFCDNFVIHCDDICVVLCNDFCDVFGDSIGDVFLHGISDDIPNSALDLEDCDCTSLVNFNFFVFFQRVLSDSNYIWALTGREDAILSPRSILEIVQVLGTTN